MLRTEIDVLMLLFEETQPDFYKAYKNARIIVDYSGGGPSKDTETGSDKPNGWENLTISHWFVFQIPGKFRNNS